MFKAKTTDNIHLPKGYVDTLYAEYGPKEVQAYINADFVNMQQGSVYYGFEREKNVVKGMEIDKNLPVNIFFDFNVYPFSAGYAQHKSPYDIRILGEWVMKGHSNTWEICSAIKDTFCKKNLAGEHIPCDLDVVIYGDASGASKTTQNKNNSSDYQIINEELKPYFNSIQYRVPKSNGSVKNRVNSVNAKLSKKYLLINETCPKLIRDYEQVCYTEQGDIDDSNIELTHSSDGSGYYINTEFPIIQMKLNRYKTTQV